MTSKRLGAREKSDEVGEVGEVKCPYCDHLGDKVVDSRESKEGDVIRRRRQCLECERRFTSYERIDQIPYMVVKKEGRRERFDRQKVLGGLLKACEKRPVSVNQLENIVDAVEQSLHESANKEVDASEVGEFVMSELKVSIKWHMSVSLPFIGISRMPTSSSRLSGDCWIAKTNRMARDRQKLCSFSTCSTMAKNGREAWSTP